MHGWSVLSGSEVILQGFPVIFLVSERRFASVSAGFFELIFFLDLLLFLILAASSKLSPHLWTLMRPDDPPPPLHTRLPHVQFGSGVELYTLLMNT